MSSAARWTSAILAPLAALFASAAWYLSRSVFFVYVLEGGASMEQVGSMRVVHGFIGMAGLVLAGAIAIVTGASVPLILGAGAMSAGLFALSVLPPEAASLAFALVGFGHAMTIPAIYGALARALDGELENLRNAAFLVVLVGLNIGGFASPLLGARLHEEGGFTPVFLTAGVLAGFALVLAVILGVVVLMARKKDPPKNPAQAGWTRAGVGASLVVVCAVPWALSMGRGVWYTLMPEHVYGLSEVETNTLQALSPATVIAVAVLGAVAFVVLHAIRVKVPALLVAGVGLAVVGIAAALSAALVNVDPTFVMVAAVLVVGAIGEALFAPLLLARTTGDLPLRLETAVAAAWSLGVRVIMMMAAPSFDEPSGRVLVWVGVLGALVVGVALAAASFPLRRVFATEPRGADGALPTARMAG